MSKYQPVSQESNSNFGFFFLMLYTAAIFIRPQEWSENGFDFPVIRVFIIIAFIAYLLAQKPKFWGVQGWCLLGLVLVIILSGLTNGWITGGFISANDFIISSVIPYLLYSSLISGTKKLKIVFAIFLFATLFMIHHGYSQISSPEGIGWSGHALSQGTRITYLGFFNDPNDLGMFFVMNIPIVFYFYKQSKSFVIKSVMLIILALILWGIYKTNSRGTLLGGLALVGLYFVFRYGKAKALAVFVICIPLVFVVMSKFRAIDTEEQSADQRIEAWYTAVVLFKSKPLFGVMKGNFTEHHFLTAHNSYALIMAELGAVGYVLWFVFIFYTLFKLLAIKTDNLIISEDKLARWQQQRANYQLQATTMFYSIFGFCVTAFFLSRSYAIVLFVFIGIACSLVHRVEREFCDIEKLKKDNVLLVKRSAILSVVSLVGLYFVVKILI